MMNSEIATSVTLNKKLIIVVLDNGGFGCIDRLQRSCGGASFNNLFPEGSGVDFAGHAASLGAIRLRPTSSPNSTRRCRDTGRRRTAVIVIATDPRGEHADGGAWWDVAVPEISDRTEVTVARQVYETALTRQKVAG